MDKPEDSAVIKADFTEELTKEIETLRGIIESKSEENKLEENKSEENKSEEISFNEREISDSIIKSEVMSLERLEEGATIFLTEEGFSEDVGVFDKATRIAKLTQNLFNKVLIIKVSDVVLEGNNKEIVNTSQGTIVIAERVKNLRVRNLRLKTGNNGVTIIGGNENIIIECCHIEGIYGVSAVYSTNIIIKDNTIKNTEIGVLFLSNCTSSCVFNNQILNTAAGILLNEKNTFIEIKENFITVVSKTDIEYGIFIKLNNSYNKIEKNIIEYAHRSKFFESDNVIAAWYGIYINSEGNCFNKILNNKIILRNNHIEGVAKTFVFRLGQIRVESGNSDIDIRDNEIITTRNTVNLEGCKIFEVSLINLYMRDCTRVNLCKNKISTTKNNFIYKKIEKRSLVDIENIRFGVGNNGFECEDNYMEVETNKVEHTDTSPSYLKNTFYNITVGLNNKSIDIGKNIFKIRDNVILEEISIILEEKNTAIEIVRNEFIGTIYAGIILRSFNNSNVILENKMEDITVLGIGLYVRNGLNIIKNNEIGNSSVYTIVALEENESNEISCNYIFNSRFGIVVYGIGNYYNTISYNRFCNNYLDLFIGDPDKNFIFDNKKQCGNEEKENIK